MNDVSSEAYRWNVATSGRVETQVEYKSYRWRVCALLFFATTINYLDRQVLGLLKPVLEGQFGWTETQYSHVVMVFMICYAIGLLLAGRLIDRLGTKIGFALCVLVWTIGACGHAAVRNTLGFAFMRGLLALGEAGNFPAAVKTVSEWFPRREQALAMGFITAGCSIGAVVAPATVPWLAATYGWEAAFFATGFTGVVWLACWQLAYQSPHLHKKVSKQELTLIESDAGEVPAGGAVPWVSLLRMRGTWIFLLGKFLTDPIWWFMLFWLPSYFSSRFNLDMKHLGLPLIIVYTATSIGSIAGGWVSSQLIARGWKVSAARQTTMFILALLVTPIIASPLIDDMWTMVGLLSLAAAAHQGWSANLYTTVSDMFPKEQVASVVGIGGMGGAVGSTLFPLAVGLVLDHYKILGNLNGGYNVIFVVCGFAYVLAWLVMWLMRVTGHTTQADANVRTGVTAS